MRRLALLLAFGALALGGVPPPDASAQPLGVFPIVGGFDLWDGTWTMSGASPSSNSIRVTRVRFDEVGTIVTGKAITGTPKYRFSGEESVDILAGTYTLGDETGGFRFTIDPRPTGSSTVS